MEPNQFEQELDLANELVKKRSYAEAKEILEKLVSAGLHEPFIYLALGDICRSMADEGSIVQSKNYLDTAIKLAAEVNDPQVAVAARSGLAKLYHQEAKQTFNTLALMNVGEELRGTLSDNDAQPMEYILYLSSCGTCTTCVQLPCRRSGIASCVSCA